MTKFKKTLVWYIGQDIKKLSKDFDYIHLNIKYGSFERVYEEAKEHFGVDGITLHLSGHPLTLLDRMLWAIDNFDAAMYYIDESYEYGMPYSHILKVQSAMKKFRPNRDFVMGGYRSIRHQELNIGNPFYVKTAFSSYKHWQRINLGFKTFYIPVGLSQKHSIKDLAKKYEVWGIWNHCDKPHQFEELKALAGKYNAVNCLYINDKNYDYKEFVKKQQELL